MLRVTSPTSCPFRCKCVFLVRIPLVINTGTNIEYTGIVRLWAHTIVCYSIIFRNFYLTTWPLSQPSSAVVRISDKNVSKLVVG